MTEAPMKRLLFVALAASLFAIAYAGEEPKAGGDARETEASAPEAKPKKERHDQATRARPRDERQPGAQKDEAKPGKPKPCEPVRPCPID
jgi:hypothetical protein